jgi:uncharacterized protein
MQKHHNIKRSLACFCFALTLINTACTNAPVSTVQSQDQLFGLVLPGQTATTNTTTTTTPNTPSVKIKNLMVWEVRSSEVNAPISYLIGTAHSALDSNYNLPEKLLAKLTTAQRFYMEADLSNGDELAQATLTYAFDPTRNNQQELTTSEWNTLKERVKTASIPEQVLNVARPWYLNLILDSPPSDGTPPNNILDQILRQKAEDAKVPLGYLETATEQLKALADGISEEKQFNVLKASLAKPPKDQVAERDKIITTYNEGSIPGFENLDQESFKEDPDYYAALVSNRNIQWANALDTILKKERAVVAIGVLHLIGPRSLTVLLTQKGYTVTPIKF